jgi:large subunit ribosomal protein L6
MSRIGKNPIAIPKGVSVNVAGDVVTVKGPKGQLQMTLHPAVKVAASGSEVVCTRDDDSRQSRAAHGLVRANTANMVRGVSEGFQRRLEINGVGYRAEASGGKKLTLQLGYSHPIEFPLPEGISAAVEKNVIVLSGIDKQALGACAATVRAFRPPEPYKGKGIKYAEETILRKVGKAAG